jgi:peptidyl-tRNA hydrolase
MSLIATSSLLLQYIGIEKVLEPGQNYCLIHVHGNQTDVSLTKRKSCIFFGSYPFGVKNLIDKLAVETKNGYQAADSLLSLYIGKIRISYNRSSGGHNGLESIIKAVKTEAFVRIRIGTAPETAKGNAKLINGEDKVEKFILGKFKEDELKELKKVGKTVVEAVAVIIKESREKAMSLFN